MVGKSKLMVLLEDLGTELEWKHLKHEDLRAAKLLEKLAPKFVTGALKLARTRAAQSVSGRESGLRPGRG